MTTLAQQFIEKPADHHIAQEVIDRLTLEITSKNEYAKYADRIVFEEPLHLVIAEMIREKQIDMHMVFRNTRLPSENIWVEWKDTGVFHKDKIYFERLGVLICPSGKTDLPIKMYVVSSLHDRNIGSKVVTVVAVYDLHTPPYPDAEIYGKLQWCLDEKELATVNLGKWQETLNLAMKCCLFGLFLLQQPKVIEKTDVQHSPQLQKKRARNNKPALLEYSHIKMRFGILGSRMGVISRQSHDGNSSLEGGGGRKRYHRVLGHFRCYHRDTEAEHVIWIEPHYRGDPAMGMLIRERTLTQYKALTP